MHEGRELARYLLVPRAGKLANMGQLVAIDLPGGPAFVAALTRIWEAGDAAAPLDQRLAPAARARALAMLRPALVIGPDGTQPGADAIEVEPGDALVMSTSGSSGEPKGVVLTHAAVAASALATSRRLGIDPRYHRWLACLPLNHIGGLSVVTRALVTGTALTVHPGFDAAAVMSAAGPEVLVSLVPTALARLGSQAFYRVVLGGSAPPQGLAPNVVTTYGLTETGSGVVYDGLPLDGVQVDLSPGGEVRLKGPMLLRAYRDGSCPLDENGWLATGDAGVLGTDGRLRVHGRLSDMIITGGENVWPATVEAVLRRHPGVADVAVTAKPDPEWGEAVVACVVPAPGPPPTLAQLRELVRAELAGFAAPKELLLLDKLPRASLGKVRRDELKRLAGGHLR